MGAPHREPIVKFTSTPSPNEEWAQGFVSALVTMPLVLIQSLDRNPLRGGGTQSNAVKKGGGFFFPPKIEENWKRSF